MDYNVKTYPNTGEDFLKSKQVWLLVGGVLAFFLVAFLFIGNDAPTTGNFVLTDDDLNFEDEVEEVVDDGLINTYSINRPSCGTLESGRIMEAFEIIAEQTDNVVKFSEDSLNGDIHFNCFVEIPKSFVYASIGGTLSDSANNVINLYNVDPIANTKFPGGCRTYPNTEIREILHVLGFEYSNTKGSMMYGVSPGCLVKDIDSDIVSSLKTMYQ